MYMSESAFSDKIKDAFRRGGVDADVVVFDAIDSTNTQAKAFARSVSDKKDTFFIAGRQSAGRGRLGRSFLSEEGGLYLSYLTYPNLNAESAIKLTAFSAVCLCETIEEFVPLSPKIKWVNDCFVGEKKLAGILTEGEFLNGGAAFKYAVVGIGVNIGKVDFGALSDIATDIESECGVCISIPDFAASLAKKLTKFESSDPNGYMKKYRELSMLTGRRVKVVSAGSEYFAVAECIENDGSLTVVSDSGKRINLISGDVSIRLN